MLQLLGIKFLALLLKSLILETSKPNLFFSKSAFLDLPSYKVCSINKDVVSGSTSAIDASPPL